MESPDTTCKNLPPLLSAFVDTFVDFAVSGLFFSNPNPNPNPNPIPNPSPTRLPAPARLVAVGDLHGDLPKSLAALSLAGLIDPFTARWTGGPSVAVQVGDVLDRGGDELRLLYLLHRLKIEASRHGGALLTIHGNHEVMNMEGDFRFATKSGFDEFRNWGSWFQSGLHMKRLCVGLDPPKDPFHGIPKSFPGVKREYWEAFRARIAALRPGGPIASRFLTDNQTIIVVGDSVFVHGGLLADHVGYGLEKINQEVRDWVNGAKGRRSPQYMRGRDSVVWVRRFSEGSSCDCDHLEEVLAMIPGVKRMVMGHTIQDEGINGVCGNRAIRVDVGLSRGCSNGLPEVLEINGGVEVRVLTANPLYGWRGYKKSMESKEGLSLLVQESRLMKEVVTKA